MKYTAPTLANERFGIKFIFPHDPRYYRAHHRRENVDCLWLEVKRVGHVFCYPFMINDHGRIYEFTADPLKKEQNEALIKRWNEIISPDNLNIDWTWNRVEEPVFRALCAQFRDDADEDDDDETETLDEPKKELDAHDDDVE